MRVTFLVATCTLALAVPASSGADPKAVLWQQPEGISLSDWIWGPGGQSRAPKPPFEFIEEDLKGTNPKLRVRDAKGDQWIVKFGGEIHGDVFASRFLYALGYVTEPSYLVARGVVTGAHDLRRAKAFLSKDGEFRYARFKLRDHNALAHAGERTWSWDDNPFIGTHEFNGLKILVMLTSNWDAKDARDGAGGNTGVYTKPGADRFYYAFDDWGATMGKWGGFFERDKWNPTGYREQTRNFARGTSGEIQWGYRGKHGSDITSGVGVEDVQWLLPNLDRITDEEWRAGLRASGATQSEIDLYARCIEDRIAQLRQVSSTPAEPAVSTALGLTPKVR